MREIVYISLREWATVVFTRQEKDAFDEKQQPNDR